MYKTGTPNDPGFHKQAVLVPAKWPILEEVLDRYNKRISILDMGCSGGHKLLNLYNKGFRSIYGIDYAEDVFKETWKRYPYLNIKKGNAENLYFFKSKQFDVIYASHLIEHLPHPEKCVKEVSRLLKKNGTFVIGIPNGYQLNDIIMRILQKLFYGKTDHLQAFSLKGITKLLNRYNFKILKTKSDLGSLDFLLDGRLNGKIYKIPEKYLYPWIKRIYWTEIHFNIVAIKQAR